MGISFKVSTIGKRFRPKPPLFETSVDEVSENSKFVSDVVKVGEDVARRINFPKSDEENEVSFTLSLFSDGYCIGKPSENGTLQDVPKDLHPYDRKSETLFSAIECGRLPGDMLEDIPCKYINGALMCEVRDYRKHTSEQGSIAPSGDEHPIVSKISLKMSLANVVKDIPLISDDSWSYRDLMELESSIVKALQPQLYLDPTPKLDRLSNAPPSIKLNFPRFSLQMKRPRTPEITVTSSKNSHGKKICIDSARESSNPRLGESGVISCNTMPQHVQDKLTVQNHGPSSINANIKDHGSQSVNISRASPASQGAMISYTNNVNSSTNLHGKRDNMDVPKSPLSPLTKKAKLITTGSNGTPQQQMGSRIESLHGSDLNRKSTLLQQQAMTRGIQFPYMGMRYGHSQLNENKNVMHMTGAETNQQPRLHQRLPQHGFMEPVIGKHVEKDKRKPVQSPRFSTFALPQSHLSFKSGEFMQKQHHVQDAAMSGVDSPASIINNRSVLLNIDSPSVETPPSPVQPMLDNFSLLDMVVTRHQRDCKKNKDNDFIVMKPKNYSAREIFTCLSNISNREDVRDDMKPLSKSLVGGSVNICKSRVVNFIQPEQIVQGNIVSMAPRARTRMVMSEKLDGTVSMYYGDLDDGGFLEMDDHPPLIPNNHMADLLAEQFCRLMMREGYLLDDHIQQEPTGDSHVSSGLSYVPQINPDNSAVEAHQYAEAVSGLRSNSSNASSQNLIANTTTLLPGNSQQQSVYKQQHSQLQRSPMILATDPLSHLNALEPNMQLGSHVDIKPSQLQLQLPHQRQQQQQQKQQQQQQQQQQKQQQYQQLQQYQQQKYQHQQQQQKAQPSQQQRQHQQKQQQYQQQQQQYQQRQQQAPPLQQMQRKIMGNTGNNMIGLGNAMGVGGVGTLGAVGNNNVGQNAMTMSLSQASSISNEISQNLRLGKLTPSQAAIMQSKLRMVQSGGSISESPLAGLAGMSGARQMQPGSSGLSMLGQTANQASMKPMQYALMEPMAPPKLKVGTNPYLNQYQQLQQQQLQQVHQQQQQQQQQQTSYRQMNQRMPMSPQEMSSGANHGTMNSPSNLEDCPPAASPQLSSQTLGSVGSIVNSPMDMQGVNKSN